ncbi:MAG: DNA topoisomerase [Eubacterium sp.]
MGQSTPSSQNSRAQNVCRNARFRPDGNKLKLGDKNIANKEQSDAILADLENAQYVVKSVKKGTRRKSPTPPFITSTLQQEASRRLSFLQSAQ